jgi:protein required for attachment to host cells
MTKFRAMHQRTWILVADAARARLFETTSVSEVWSLIDDFQNPQGRARGRDFRADASGDFQTNEGTVRRSAMEPLSIKRVEAERFARMLGVELDKGLSGGRYDRVILVAPPEFLGLIRAELTPAVEKRVFDTIAKDFTSEDPRVLSERIETAQLE